MSTNTRILERIQARRCLEEVNRFLLGSAGEILETPGKLNLVWDDPVRDRPCYLAVKAAGDDQVLVNGRLYPASEASLKQAIKACLKEFNR